MDLKTQLHEACSYTLYVIRATQELGYVEDEAFEDAKGVLVKAIERLDAQDATTMPAPLTLDSKKRATMVAALRYYQQEGQGDPSNRSDLIHQLATNSDTVISLDSAGVEELIEFITNAGCEESAKDIPIGSRVILRRGGHDAPAPGR